MNIKRNQSEIFNKKNVTDLVSILANSQKSFHFQKTQQPHLQKADILKPFKTKWKDPGYPKGQFAPAPILRAKVLNQWQIERTNLSKRSYKPPINFKGLKIDHFSKQFPQAKDNLYSPKFRQHLNKVRQQFQNKQFTTNKMSLEFNRNASKSFNLKNNRSQMRFHIQKNTLFGFPNRKQNSGYYSTSNLSRYFSKKANTINIFNKN